MRSHSIVAAFVLAGALVAAPAFALNEPVWLQITAGGSSYGMSNLNQSLTEYNQSVAGVLPSYPLVHDGLGFGLAAGVELPNRWTLGLGLDRLYAQTEVSDASGGLRYQFTANAWRLFAEYALRPVGSNTLRFGLGVGLLGESGKLTESIPGDAPYDYKMRGSAPLYETYAGADLWITPKFALTGSGGYRHAKLPQATVDYAVFINANGEAMELDYSGAYARVGFKLLSMPSAD